MKKTSVTIILTMLCLIAGFVLTGCGESQSPEQQPLAPAANTSSVTTSNAETGVAGDSYLTKIKFKATDGSEALIIKRYSDHDKIEINFAGTKAEIKARSGAENRWKYKETVDGSEDKTLVAEVKLQADSFKLVDENEKLLWKVRIKEGKIKVSDNEDGNNSWEIKSKSADKSEIRSQNGNEIGNVKFYADNGKLKVKDAANTEILVSKDLKASAAPGVILFTDIPLKHRIVIISELLRMGE